MNFEVGDEVIYNPSVSPLPPIENRPWDLGKIRKIKTGYLYFESYSNPKEIRRIKPEAFSYSKSSPKYIRSVYALLIKDIHEGFLQRKTRIVKNLYLQLEKELIKAVFKNERHTL